jgi:hypothetical protein
MQWSHSKLLKILGEIMTEKNRISATGIFILMVMLLISCTPAQVTPDQARPTTAPAKATSTPAVSDGSSNIGEAEFLSIDPGPDGTITLAEYFSPDPFSITFFPTLSGPVDATYLNNSDCVGYANVPPAFRLIWQGVPDNEPNDGYLEFNFVGDTDTVLIVYDAVGDWRCNDNSLNTIHPSINIQSPEVGIYDIWVGTTSDLEEFSGTLYITDGTSVQGE